ncbi:geranylgeranyl transferas-like protein type i beta subunit [Saccharata proteae CBS 121410]|uniref:Geranylgeranyl transferas-like protein type i beta subunit n=1 Tax=Saccharata proteae CBS 121410 TaxID=1314787 RepID=A0A9P4LXI4_9PEZI|nr:geranylgeranyl transferas-like protein type i beta subunit [Saccharata proteae CBS 121410]
MNSSEPGPSQLNLPKHLQYWKRCLKTYLPHLYTSNDCNRMTLGFFIISALDLLDALNSCTTTGERDDYITWIYHNQHPSGGFRGSPATNLGEQNRNKDNECWDPANLPATFFALATLVLLGDGLEKVKRRECLAWLNTVQRQDGSFGEFLGENGRIEGGQDTRFGYCATGVRWMLRGDQEDNVEGVRDIDIEALVRCIRKAQTYDGGISEAPFHEAHAGFTYCAIGALSFLNRLPPNITASHTNNTTPLPGIPDPALLTRWLVMRQTATLDEEDASDTYADETDSAVTCHDAHSYVKLQQFPSQKGEMSFRDRPTTHFELQWAGFNGRCNKIADTCYAWWVEGSLSMLDALPHTNVTATRRYLLDKAQHPVGGFSKIPGDPPDIYHSYLGLAAIALMQEKGVKPINAAACISEDACRRLEGLEWRRGGGEMPAKSANGTKENGKSLEGSLSYMAMTGG